MKTLLKTSTLRGMLLAALFLLTSYAYPKPVDYSRLVELMQHQDKKEDPLYVLFPFDEELDQSAHQENLGYFNKQPDLVKNIQKDLASRQLQWRLDRYVQRLLFVPQDRNEYLTLFEAYCKEVIPYVLKRIELKNPLVKIETLQRERPHVSGHGVTAFLVNNLVKEGVGTYVFSNPRGDSLMIKIGNKAFLGEVGSYTSDMHFTHTGEVEFTLDNFTIWKTSVDNPFALLTVPVEETLHAVLREHTHKAIKKQFAANQERTEAELKMIGKEWMAVEEAIVGGLVHALLPPFLRKHVRNLPEAMIKDDLEARSEFDQYMYLKNGIEAVNSLGCKEAIRMYQQHPEMFKKLLG